MANKAYSQVQIYVFYTFGVFPRTIALVLRKHALIQACGVMTSLHMMSVKTFW